MMGKKETRREIGWYKLVLFEWGQISPKAQYIYKSFCMSKVDRLSLYVQYQKMLELTIFF